MNNFSSVWNKYVSGADCSIEELYDMMITLQVIESSLKGSAGFEEANNKISLAQTSIIGTLSSKGYQW